MNKYREALEKLNHTICLNLNDKRLKFGLDKYKDGPRGDSCDCESFEEFCQCYNTLEQSLDRTEELEKVLEIIKKKNVDIGYFREDFVKNNDGFDLYEEYPTTYHYGTDKPWFEYKGEFLTQEEFNLLKEILL